MSATKHITTPDSQLQYPIRVYSKKKNHAFITLNLPYAQKGLNKKKINKQTKKSIDNKRNNKYHMSTTFTKKSANVR